MVTVLIFDVNMDRTSVLVTKITSINFERIFSIQSKLFSCKLVFRQKGNKIHSCGISAAQSEAAKVEFVTCQMSYGSEGINEKPFYFTFVDLFC